MSRMWMFGVVLCASTAGRLLAGGSWGGAYQEPTGQRLERLYVELANEQASTASRILEVKDGDTLLRGRALPAPAATLIGERLGRDRRPAYWLIEAIPDAQRELRAHSVPMSVDEVAERARAPLAKLLTKLIDGRAESGDGVTVVLLRLEPRFDHRALSAQGTLRASRFVQVVTNEPLPPRFVPFLVIRGGATAPAPLASAAASPPAEASPAAPEPVEQDMVLIPAGEFLMGDSGGLSKNPSDGPPKRVHVDAFWIDKHEVTNARYRAFVEKTNHKPPRSWQDERFRADDQPVIGVTWEDAVAYCTWAGKRLPTEAEWEKACRGGIEGAEFPWGSGTPQGKAHFDQDEKKGRPAPVGSYAANGYGLFDMAGNAWEWCADWYDVAYLKKAEPRNPRGPASGPYHSIRGGGWFTGHGGIRAAFRSVKGDPNKPPTPSVGFRCAKDAAR